MRSTPIDSPEGYIRQKGSIKKKPVHIKCIVERNICFKFSGQSSQRVPKGFLTYGTPKTKDPAIIWAILQSKGHFKNLPAPRGDNAVRSNRRPGQSVFRDEFLMNYAALVQGNLYLGLERGEK